MTLVFCFQLFTANDLNYDSSIENEVWPKSRKIFHEIVLSWKRIASGHPAVYFNNILVNATTTHKHLTKILESKPSYKHHLQSAWRRVNRIIVFLRKLQLNCPRQSLITIYRSFSSPHLDYVDQVFSTIEFLTNRLTKILLSNKWNITWEARSKASLGNPKTDTLVEKTKLVL